MFEKKWVRWLVVLITMLVVSLGGSTLLYFQGAKSPMIQTSAVCIGLLGLLVSYLWLSFGLFVRRKTPWIWWAGLMVHGSVILLITTYLLFNPPFHVIAPQPRVAVASFAIWSLGCSFLVGMWLVRVVLSPGIPILAVARTVVDEAIGLRIFLVPIILAICTVAILPVVLDPGERLEYRIQTFLSWSISCTAALLSVMTVFLACATVCNEIKDKQIYLTMTKPVSRFQYIIGKWLGITMINMVLVLVMGLGIYNFTKLLEVQFALSEGDRYIVETRVLVARQGVSPVPTEGTFDNMLQAQLTKLRAQDPVTYGPDMSKDALNSIKDQVISSWFNIPYGGSGTFKFFGLASARKYTDVIQLRLKADCSPRPADETMTLFMLLNGSYYPVSEGHPIPIRVVVGQYQVLSLPIDRLDKNGDLAIEFQNATVGDYQGESRGVSISFTKGDGLEILYRTGSFDLNLVKSMLMVWFRLVFLAMAGIMAGTFLGFPVACMLSIMIFLVSTCSSFFNESLENYVALNPDLPYHGNPIFAPLFTMKQHLFGSGDVKPDYYKALKLCVRLFGQFFVMLVPAFSDFDPIPLLVDGREVPVKMLTDGLEKMALVWTLVCLVIGWFIFRTKELARVII